MVYLIAYFSVAAILLAIALVRERGAANYHDFCATLGLCLLWPITLTLELTLAWYNRAR